MEVKDFEDMLDRFESRLKERYYFLPKTTVAGLIGASVTAIALLGITSWLAARTVVNSIASEAAGQTYLSRVKANSEQLDKLIAGSSRNQFVGLIKEQRQLSNELTDACMETVGCLRNVMDIAEKRKDREFNWSVPDNIQTHVEKANEHRKVIDTLVANGEIFKDAP